MVSLKSGGVVIRPIHAQKSEIQLLVEDERSPAKSPSLQSNEEEFGESRPKKVLIKVRKSGDTDCDFAGRSFEAQYRQSGNAQSTPKLRPSLGGPSPQMTILALPRHERSVKRIAK